MIVDYLCASLRTQKKTTHQKYRFEAERRFTGKKLLFNLEKATTMTSTSSWGNILIGAFECFLS